MFAECVIYNCLCKVFISHENVSALSTDTSADQQKELVVMLDLERETSILQMNMPFFFSKCTFHFSHC